jgi:hypothetical protein
VTPRSIRTNALLLVAVLLAGLALVALGVSLAWGANDQRELARVVETNCRQIEALKARFRSQAHENYARLEQDARLLGITLTPELREAARQGRDRTLLRFAESDC